MRDLSFMSQVYQDSRFFWFVFLWLISDEVDQELLE